MLDSCFSNVASVSYLILLKQESNMDIFQKIILTVFHTSRP